VAAWPQCQRLWNEWHTARTIGLILWHSGITIRTSIAKWCCHWRAVLSQSRKPSEKRRNLFLEAVEGGVESARELACACSVSSPECSNTTWVSRGCGPSSSNPVCWCGVDHASQYRESAAKFLFARPTSLQRSDRADVADSGRATHLIAGVVQHYEEVSLTSFTDAHFPATFRPDACNRVNYADLSIPMAPGFGIGKSCVRRRMSASCTRRATAAMAWSDRPLGAILILFESCCRQSDAQPYTSTYWGAAARLARLEHQFLLSSDSEELSYHDREICRVARLHSYCQTPTVRARSPRQKIPQYPRLDKSGLHAWAPTTPPACNVVADDYTLRSALEYLVVQHGWQSRALGSHPHGHSADTTPGAVIAAWH
jgi:hypothetical protein